MMVGLVANVGPIWDGGVPLAAGALKRRLEGFSANPYDDNGKARRGTWTIGYGSTRLLNGSAVRPTSPTITEGEAQHLLDRDLEIARATVRRNVTTILREAEAAALISWVDNLGEPNLLISTMLVRLNEGERASVPPEMGRWFFAYGQPNLGLRRRRWAEGGIFQGFDPTAMMDMAWSAINRVEDWPAYPRILPAASTSD